MVSVIPGIKRSTKVFIAMKQSITAVADLFDVFGLNDARAILSSAPGLEVAHLPWGEECTTRLSNEEMDGALSIFDYRAPAGFGPPRHIHHREDEIFRVISGQAAFWTPESSGSIRAGDVLKLPKDVEHVWRSYGTEPLRLIVVVTPGGLEKFFNATEEANVTETDMAGRTRISSQFGVDMTGAPLTDSDVGRILQGQRLTVDDLGA